MPNYKRYYLQDYSYIFITIVTYERKELLLDNIQLLREAFLRVKQNYEFEIVAICVLKDHLHMIIKEKELKNFSKIVSNFKKYFSYNLSEKQNKENLPKSMQKRKEAGVWQRRFYDHIIRNQDDFNKHVDYIHYNPYKHYQIPPKDWKYSSFDRFVKSGYYEVDWCNFEDDIELE